MKKISVILIFTAIMLYSGAVMSAQQPEGPGFGIIVGEPTGISIKYKNFPVLGFAWSIDNHFHMHCDYWAHLAPIDKSLSWYAGAGGKFRVFNNDSRDRGKKDNSRVGIGIRVPFGLQYLINSNIELFAEVVPGISLIPSTDFDLDAGIGARYYF